MTASSIAPSGQVCPDKCPSSRCPLFLCIGVDDAAGVHLRHRNGISSAHELHPVHGVPRGIVRRLRGGEACSGSRAALGTAFRA